MKPFIGHSIVCAAVLVLAASASAETPDSRLDQRVTYAGGYKRLRDVAADLTKQTGVTIRAGKSAADWQSADLPITVHAKDLPLGKLLGVLADACHIALVSSQVGEGERAYRFRFGDQQIREAADRKASERAIALASVEWVWDSYLRCVDIPDSEFGAAEVAVQGAKFQGKLLKSLGADGKRRVLSGEPLLAGDEFRKLLQDVPPALLEPPPSRSGDIPPVDELKRSSLLLWFDDGASGGLPGLRARVVSEDGIPSQYAGELVGVGPSWFKETQPGMTAPPERYSPSKDPIPAGFVKLADEPDFQSFAARVRADELPAKLANGKPVEVADPKWRSALLGKKAKLVLPEDDYTLADALAVMAKACECSVVCEDFESHGYEPIWRSSLSEEQMDGVLRAETTIGEKLIALGDRFGTEWLVDSQSGIMLGRPLAYSYRHANLMPQAVLSGLKAKGDGPGYDFDDAIDLGQYSEGQIREWIYGSRDLGYVQVIAHGGPQLLLIGLYAKLTPQQRSVARSDTGLALSQLDPGWVKEFFASEGPLGKAVLTGDPLSVRWSHEGAAAFKTLAEPSSYSSVTLHVRKTAESDGGPRQSSYKYVLTLDGLGLGSVFKSEIGGFPIYSPKRAEELRKAAGE